VLLEQIVVLLVDLGLDPMCAPLIVAKLEILTPFWAISNALAHVIFALAWERFVVLYQT
jgi:hypothetical protein